MLSRFIAVVVGVLLWLQSALWPTLTGLILGFLTYLIVSGTTRVIAGTVLLAIGIAVSVKTANKKSNNKDF